MDFPSLTAPSMLLHMTNKEKKCYSENQYDWQHCAFHYSRQMWHVRHYHRVSNTWVQERKWLTAVSVCILSMHCEMEACPHAIWFVSVDNVSLNNACHHLISWDETMKNDCSRFLISIPKCIVTTIKFSGNIYTVSAKWATAEANCENSTWLRSLSFSPWLSPPQHLLTW